MQKEFEVENDRLWNEKINILFNEKIPQQKIWTDIYDIINVLNFVGTTEGLNHLFFPIGGGLDLTGSNSSIEEGCIELFFNGSVEIAKVNKLIFNSFDKDNNNKWSYFRLETDNLEASDVFNNCGLDYEELTEISPGQYLERSVWDFGYYGCDINGNPIRLPSGSRVITRSLKGSYVIFSKSSYYNQVIATYDGRHNKMDSESFRNMIIRSIDKF